MAKENNNSYYVILIVVIVAVVAISVICINKERISISFDGFNIEENIAGKAVVSESFAVSECMEITESGYYYLTNNLNVPGSNICLRTMLGNPNDLVTIDCQGHYIIGELTSFDYDYVLTHSAIGIDHPFSNIHTGTIHIKNCKFKDIFEPIAISQESESISTITNNRIIHSYYGIVIGDWPGNLQTGNILIKNNLIEDTFSNEVTIHHANNIEFQNNNICGVASGYYGSYNIFCNSASPSGYSRFNSQNCELTKKPCLSINYDYEEYEGIGQGDFLPLLDLVR